MKILLEQKEYTELDIEYPFFAYCQEEYKNVYVKITEKEFFMISITHNTVEMFVSKNQGYLASVWYNNKGTEKQFNDALETAKKYLQNMTKYSKKPVISHRIDKK